MKQTTSGSSHADPILIFVRGMPGSGKSYFTYALKNALNDTALVIIDPDEVDTADPEYTSFSKQLSSEGLAEAIHPFRWLRKKAGESITRDAVIVWNQPFTVKGIFDRLIEFLKKEAAGKSLSLKVLLIEIDVPKEVAKNRIQQRKANGGHGPSDATFDRRADDYTSFSKDYDSLKLDGQDDVKSLIVKAVDKINSL